MNINNWTETQEELLKKWYKEAKALNWKHIKAANSYSFRGNLIGIPSVIASTIAGTATFINLDSKGQCDNNIYIQIGTGILNISTAILLAIHLFLKLGETAEKHRSSAARYKNFYNSIESELVLPREERLNGKIFVKQAQKRFNELLEICPSIPTWIEKDYQKHIDNMDSLECGNLNEVLINDILLPKSKSKTNKKNSNDDSSSDDKSSDDKSSDDKSSDESDNSSKSLTLHNLQSEMNEELRRDNARERLRSLDRKETIDRFNNYF